MVLYSDSGEQMVLPADRTLREVKYDEKFSLVDGRRAGLRLELKWNPYKPPKTSVPAGSRSAWRLRAIACLGLGPMGLTTPSTALAKTSAAA